MSSKKLLTAAICLVFFTSTLFANKSVFIISQHNDPSGCQAYSIEGDEVVYQANVDISGYNQGIGAVANAVWPDRNLMFVTYEKRGFFAVNFGVFGWDFGYNKKIIFFYYILHIFGV